MKCSHRNCHKEFDYKSNKKYCSRSCKNKESVYRGRDLNKSIYEKVK